MFKFKSDLPIASRKEFATTTIVGESADEIFFKVLDVLNEYGEESAPRGLKIKELINFSFKLTNPRKRIMTNPLRKMSLPFAFGEWLWYINGKNDLETMGYYGSKMKTFSDDGETINSAYGYRIFGKHNMLPFDQWQFVIDKLSEDGQSRQAIIHLHTPNNKPTKDEVCTLTLQFMIRNGKLDMITNMRSNDLVWGLTYDLFSFTMIQESIANELGIDVGDYYHNAGSMHIYENYFHMFDSLYMLDEIIYMSKFSPEFPISGVTRHSKEWSLLSEAESIFRQGNVVAEKIKRTEEIHNSLEDGSLLQSFVSVLDLYNTKKYHADELDMFAVDLMQTNNVIDWVMLNYLYGEKELPYLEIVEGPDGAGKSTYAEGLENITSIIHFDKPDKTFNKYLYFMSALSMFPVALDRFFYSELVYSNFYTRQPLLGLQDVKVIENILNHRGAKLTVLGTHYEACFKRLSGDDLEAFNEADLKRLCDSYLLQFRVSKVKNKNYIK